MRLICFLLLFTSLNIYAKMTASVDKKSIRYGQSLQLNLSSDNAAGLNPNLSKLKRQFKILGTSKVSRPYIKNGQRQIKTLWFYILQPKVAGNLTVPVFKVNGEVSTAITIRVSAIKKAKTKPTKKILSKKVENAHNIIVKASLNKQKFYPNEMLEYRLTINAPIDKKGNFEVIPPFIADAIVLPLAPLTSKRAKLRGKERIIYNQSFAIFAESVAIYQVEPANISYSETQSQNEIKRISLKANNLHFEITQKANQTSLGYWLPSESVNLLQVFDIPDIITKGDTIKRTLILKAKSLDVDSLPLMSTLTHEDIKISLEDVTLDSQVIDGELITTRSETIAMTFKSSGNTSIEPIDIHWWNTKLDQARVASIQAYSFKITEPKSVNQSPIIDDKNALKLPEKLEPEKNLPDLIPAKETVEKTFSNNQLNAIIFLLFILLVGTTAGWLISLRHKKSLPS